jgi:hypothetical protein
MSGADNEKYRCGNFRPSVPFLGQTGFSDCMIGHEEPDSPSVTLQSKLDCGAKTVPMRHEREAQEAGTMAKDEAGSQEW